MFKTLIATMLSVALMSVPELASAKNYVDEVNLQKTPSTRAHGTKHGHHKSHKSKKHKSTAHAQSGQYVRTSYKPSQHGLNGSRTSFDDLAGLNHSHNPLDLQSNAALVIDQNSAEVLFDKNSQIALPMASITKLMTAMVVLDAHQDLDEILTVTDEDIDRAKNSHSRLHPGDRLSRRDMLHIALMSSENRAASALGRNYPGGLAAFIPAMNAKAQAVGMTEARYEDPTGLSSHNVASARDLAKLAMAAYQYPTIREFSTDTHYTVSPGDGRLLQYRSSNRLVDSQSWEIGLQKTGYISEAGRCLVMQARVSGRPVIMVFLDSKGKYSRLADANRVKKWLASGEAPSVI